MGGFWVTLPLGLVSGSDELPLTVSLTRWYPSFTVSIESSITSVVPGETTRVSGVIQKKLRECPGLYGKTSWYSGVIWGKYEIFRSYLRKQRDFRQYNRRTIVRREFVRIRADTSKLAQIRANSARFSRQFTNFLPRELWQTLGEHWRTQVEFARIHVEFAANWQTVRQKIFNLDSDFHFEKRLRLGLGVGLTLNLTLTLTLTRTITLTLISRS
jgi:hypothetical protein